MLDIYINPKTGDIEFENGDVRVTSTKGESLRQRMYITLNTWQGTWFWDTTYGIPYIQAILGKPRTKDEVDAIYLSAITQYEDEYDTLDEFTTEFNRDLRHYQAVFKVTLQDGDDVTNITPPPVDEDTYPDPPENILVPYCPTPLNYILEAGNWLAQVGYVWGDNNATELGGYFQDEERPEGRPIVAYYYTHESGGLEAEAGNDVEAGEKGNIPELYYQNITPVVEGFTANYTPLKIRYDI